MCTIRSCSLNLLFKVLPILSDFQWFYYEDSTAEGAQLLTYDPFRMKYRNKEIEKGRQRDTDQE